MDHQLQPTIDDKVLSNDLKNLQHVISTESHDFSFGYGYPGYELTQEDEPSKTRDQIIHLIELNKEYQEILSVFVRHIEAAKCRNIELQKKIRAASQSNKRRTTVKKPQGTPFFCDSQNDAPLWNKDTQMKVEQERKVPTHFKFKKWSKSERNCLAEGIVQQNKQILYNEMMAERQNNPDGKSLAETAKMVTEHINSLPKEHFHENIVGIDWEVVSKQFVPTRTAIDCQLQWTNVDHTSINHGSWTKAEDKKLLEVAKRYKHHEWTLIAKELGTNRTAFQCFRRFQRSLNTSIVKGKWTQEEDQALKAAIKQYGDKNWQQVAHCLDGRTGQQCLHRWQKTLHPNIKRGRWTPEEDKALTLAVKAYGSKSWVKVQKHVPGRTDVQCRERWVNILNPKLNVGAWTPEEDKKLEEFVATKGPGKWAEAAARLFPRTDNQCWRRWKTLHQEALNSYRQNILKKKIGMVNNFVGREKERPQLTPEDLDLGVTAMSSQNEYRHESSVPLPLDDISVTTYEESPLLLSFDKKDYPSTYSPHKPLPDSLPLLLPQQDTFEALDRLIRCLGEVQSTTLGSNRLEDEEKLVTNPEFTLLAGVFNGLFLCPTLLHARTYFGVDEEQSHHDVDTTTNIELI